MSIDFKELKSKMEKAGEHGAASKLNMRDESKQEKFVQKRFRMLKKEKKKKAKLLLLKEIAIPFDPATGDDTVYNENRKWRPTFSVSSTMKMAKSYANSNEKSKSLFMKYANVSEWDTSNPDVLTETDYKVFKRYITPRIFSIPAVHVTIPSMTGNRPFGQDYTVDVKINPVTGEYEGDVPIILQAHKFFIEMAYEELQDYQKKLETGEIKHDEKAQANHKSEIFQKVMISGLAPINFVQAFEVPLDLKSNLKDESFLVDIDESTINDQVVLIRRNKAITDTLNKFTSGEYEKFDIYPEYYAVDMSCPNDTDVASEIGQRTTYERELTPLKELKGFEHFRDAFNDFVDSYENLEETVFRSSYVHKYDESVDRKILQACNSLIDTDSPYFTKKVIESNKDFLVLALGEKMDSFLAEIEFGVSDKKEGSLDSDAAKKEAKVYDIASELDNLEDFDDTVDTEVVV